MVVAGGDWWLLGGGWGGGWRGGWGVGDGFTGRDGAARRCCGHSPAANASPWRQQATPVAAVGADPITPGCSVTWHPGLLPTRLAECAPRMPAQILLPPSAGASLMSQDASKVCCARLYLRVDLLTQGLPMLPYRLQPGFGLQAEQRSPADTAAAVKPLPAGHAVVLTSKWSRGWPFLPACTDSPAPPGPMLPAPERAHVLQAGHPRRQHHARWPS